MKQQGKPPTGDLIGVELDDMIRSIAPNLSDLEIDEFRARIIETPRARINFVAEKGGKSHHYNLPTYRLSGEENQKIFLILFDEIDEKLRESSLRLKEEEVANASKLASLGEMAAGIAHELKTPLNTMFGIRQTGKKYDVCLSNSEKTIRLGRWLL